MKRPLVLIASLMRRTRVDIWTGSTQARGLGRQLETMGEPLHRAASPTGFPDVSEAWTSPGALLQRFQLIAITELGSRSIRGTATPSQTVDSLIGRYLPGGISLQSRSAVRVFLEETDPNDYRRIPTAAALVLSSPEFMRH